MTRTRTGCGVGTIGRAEAAYFDKLNAAGGVNGRRINLISLDDGYAPPRAVEQTRKLVERAKGVLMDSQSLKEAEAFRRIQRLSMNSRKSMREVAEAILLAHEAGRSL